MMACMKKPKDEPEEVEEVPEKPSPFRQVTLSLPSNLKPLKLAPQSLTPLGEFHVPEVRQEGENLQDSWKTDIVGGIVSTYPIYPGSTFREGDPICDHIYARIYPDHLLLSLADGCGWGTKPRLAAEQASMILLNSLEEGYSKCKTLEDVQNLLLFSLERAHNGIITQKENLWEVGTTTILAGTQLLVLKDTPEGEKKVPHFVGISIGDAKLYHYSAETQTIHDLTQGKRPSDPSDCGGRIGPQLPEGRPDLRNLSYVSTEAGNSDIFMCLSDGVHDNLDPELLGLGIETIPGGENCGFTGTDGWKEIDHDQLVKLKTSFQENYILTHFIQPFQNSLRDACSAVLAHCRQTTQPGRTFMETMPGKKLPDDYSTYPGKMDHSSCLMWQVKTLYD